MRDRIITVAASGYFQPILDLCERLIQQPRNSVRASRISYRENGYSLSIVLLSVVMFEAFVGRVSDLQSRLGPKGKVKAFRTTVPKYIVSLRKSFTLEKSLTEVFILRDVIAHSHVWSLEVSSHKTYGTVLRSATLGSQYGNEQFRKRVNLTTRKTRAIGLHVVPSAVGRDEVVKVLDVIERVLSFLVRTNLIEPNAISFNGRLKGAPFEFWRIVGVLKSAA